MARAWTSSLLRLLTPTSRHPPHSTFTAAIRHHSTEAAAAAANPRTPSPTNPSTISDLVRKSRLYNLSFYRSLYPMRSAPKRKVKRLHLPTHYVEVSYKLRKAVVFYQPSIAHIPHGCKERNPVLVTSGASRGRTPDG